MDTFTKKLMASLMAIALIASAFAGIVMTGTAQGQSVTYLCPLDEDFSGSSWLPSGWTQEEDEEWNQNSSNHAGGTSPEALLYWNDISGDYAYLDSKPVDTSGAMSMTLEFKSYINNFAGGYDCRVLTRADGGDSWNDVTPWANPIGSSIVPDTYSVDISSDIGSATQVRFEFEGYYWNLNYWYVDDVKICGYVAHAVGGEAYPVNKLTILAPWIAVAVALAGGISSYVLRRRRV